MGRVKMGRFLQISFMDSPFTRCCFNCLCIRCHFSTNTAARRMMRSRSTTVAQRRCTENGFMGWHSRPLKALVGRYVTVLQCTPVSGSVVLALSGHCIWDERVGARFSKSGQSWNPAKHICWNLAKVHSGMISAYL